MIEDTEAVNAVYRLITVLVVAGVFLAALIWLQFRYRKLCNNYDELLRDSSAMRERLHGAECLLNCMARLGKMRYFIVSPDNATVLMEGGDESAWIGSFKPPETYISGMAPRDREHFLDHWHRLLAGDINSFYENYHLYQNGVPRRYLEYAEAYSNRETGRRLVLVAAMDVSALEKQNLELADADQMLKAIFDNLPGYLFTKNAGGDFSYIRCNSAFSELLDKTPDEIYGKNDFELFSTDHATRIRSVDLETLRGNTRIDHKWFITAPNGQQHALRVLKRLLRRSDGSSYILGFGVDISQQENAERSLRRRNKELRLLLNHLPGAVMLLDMDFHIVAANSKLARLFGVSDEELRLKHCFELGCQCGAPPGECTARLALSSGRCHARALSDGYRGRELLVIAQPIRDENNQITHIAMVYYDVGNCSGGAEALLAEIAPALNE